MAIEQALMYEDGRSHYVFNDRSGLILHPKGDCFTYFSKDGRKIRQVVKYAVKSLDKDDNGIGILDKLILAIQFHNTFGDEVIASREEVVIKKGQQKITKFQKVT